MNQQSVVVLLWVVINDLVGTVKRAAVQITLVVHVPFHILAAVLFQEGSPPLARCFSDLSMLRITLLFCPM
jgi:hypothetical protein